MVAGSWRKMQKHFDSVLHTFHFKNHGCLEGTQFSEEDACAFYMRSLRNPNTRIGRAALRLPAEIKNRRIHIWVVS